jgi:hypothetical protein
MLLESLRHARLGKAGQSHAWFSRVWATVMSCGVPGSESFPPDKLLSELQFSCEASLPSSRFCIIKLS